MSNRRLVTAAPVALLSGLLPILMGTAPTVAAQQQVYRTVRPDGSVLFSDRPPPDANPAQVDRVQIAPGPTPEQREAATQRVQEVQQRTMQRSDDGAAEPTPGRPDVAGAERQLEKARLNLKQAELRGDGDWQTIASGGRVPSAAFLDRVEQARQQVSEAEEALRRARRDARRR